MDIKRLWLPAKVGDQGWSIENGDWSVPMMTALTVTLDLWNASGLIGTTWLLPMSHYNKNKTFLVQSSLQFWSLDICEAWSILTYKRNSYTNSNLNGFIETEQVNFDINVPTAVRNLQNKGKNTHAQNKSTPAVLSCQQLNSTSRTHHRLSVFSEWKWKSSVQSALQNSLQGGQMLTQNLR